MVDAICPDPLSERPVRIAEAERHIRHYRQATGDIEGTLDVMLSFVEAGTELAADFGYDDDRFFGSLERVLDAVAAQLDQLSPDSQQDAVQRIEWIADKAQPVGWGYCDYTREIAIGVNESVTGPPAVDGSGSPSGENAQPRRE